MSTELICPECGGIIGATSADHGKPCICFSTSGGDTSMLGKAAPAKVCCKCGKDLTGKKRLKDSRGYWCDDCHKADRAANRPKGARCADCGRVVPEAGLIEYSGIKICKPCLQDRAASAKQRRKYSNVSTKAHSAEDRKRMMMLLGVFGVLLMIVILSHLHILPALF